MEALGLEGSSGLDVEEEESRPAGGIEYATMEQLQQILQQQREQEQREDGSAERPQKKKGKQGKGKKKK